MATIVKARRPPKRKPSASRTKTPVAKKPARKSLVKKDAAAGYNAFKEFKGQAYTGMQVGRSHKWNYDKGVWRETKITPERWELNYNVIKRRAGHAPEGTGVPVGTGYHWFILAHQYVEKLNADDYTTSMVGIKYKLAHKRSTSKKWNVSDTTQRKHLIQLLKDMIKEFEKEPQKTVPIPLEFSYKGKQYSGMAIPVMSSCAEGICNQLNITLNNKHLGVIRSTPKGWRITDVPQGLVNAIRDVILQWYE